MDRIFFFSLALLLKICVIADEPHTLGGFGLADPTL